MKRMGYFTDFLTYFGLPSEENLGCALMQPFAAESASNSPQSLDKNWDLVNECRVAPYST